MSICKQFKSQISLRERSLLFSFIYTIPFLISILFAYSRLSNSTNLDIVGFRSSTQPTRNVEITQITRDTMRTPSQFSILNS
ncbi:MAG: hypothetical protein F6K31_00115 [Symploca sp. SIO2G7]|nr:hypothetical protein [Symploca sp. SIO2G7]